MAWSPFSAHATEISQSQHMAGIAIRYYKMNLTRHALLSTDLPFSRATTNPAPHNQKLLCLVAFNTRSDHSATRTQSGPLGRLRNTLTSQNNYSYTLTSITVAEKIQTVLYDKAHL